MNVGGPGSAPPLFNSHVLYLEIHSSVMGIREAALRMAASAPCTLQLGCCQRHPHACQASELVAALQLGSQSAPLPSDRFALVLCGGVSLLYRSAKGTMARASSEAGLAADGFGVVVNSSSNPLYNGGFPPTPLHITLSSLRQHIIDANDRSGGGRFDLFAHSWAPNLEGGLPPPVQSSHRPSLRTTDIVNTSQYITSQY